VSVTYRTARADEARAASRIITAALDDLAARQDRPPLEVPEDHAAPVLRHLIDTDGERFWLAIDDERPVAFGAGWVRGRLGYCGGLFVLPEWQGKGVGRRLFELALAGLPAAGGVAALTSSAANPVSNGLYARHGIYPLFALLSLSGPTAGWSDRAGSTKLEAHPLADHHLDILREIDETVLGVDRTREHRWHLDTARNCGWLFRSGDRAAGYAYLGGDGTEGPGAIGPVAALRAQDQPLLLRFALAELASRGVERATVIVPGPNFAAQRLLWGTGFSFTGASGLLCASRPFGRFDRYLLSGDALM
jgi:ribosomal protein S18 acetylase RimI-like enzyme